MKSTKIKARKKFKTLQKINSKRYNKNMNNNNNNNNNNKTKKSLLFASTMIRSAATKPHQSSKSGIVFFW